MENAGSPLGTIAIANEMLGLLGTGRQTAPISARYPGFRLTEAYEVAAEIAARRRDRGETPVGRKIGFTNRSVWQNHGISGPIWGYLYDSTVRDLDGPASSFSLDRLPEPRIEPEMVLHLSHTPQPGMDEAALARCVDWAAHGFEIVFSPFPGWQFSAADAAAAFGVHAALLLGERHSFGNDTLRALSSFDVELSSNRGARVQGRAANVLGGPLSALKFLVEELARLPNCEPLHAGEIVTTGTLTEAMAASAGEVWTTRPSGIEMQGIQIALVDG